MNFKEIKNEIKNLFVNLKEELIEIQLTTIKTKNDTILSYEGDLGIGTEISIVNEDATLVPVEDGEYILEDNSKLITVDGKVSEIIAPESIEEDAPVEEAPVEPVIAADTEIPVEDVIEDVVEANPIEDRITKIEEQINKILEILDAMTSNLEANELKTEVKMSMEKPIYTLSQRKNLGEEENLRGLTSQQIVYKKLYN